MSVIYFRTDGNEKIATGHIMRCLSIARACSALNVSVCFLVSDETSADVLRQRFSVTGEFQIHCLQSDYQKMETELPALHKLLQSENFPCLFIDSYFVTKTYLAELGRFCRIAYMDDLLAFPYPADCLINYDITKTPDCYRLASHCLLGPAYAPLRSQFQNVPYTVRPAVKNILLSTGGTDTYNVAGKLLELIFDTLSDTFTGQCEFHVITSRLNTHFEELETLNALHPTVHIHENVHDMASLMCRCDLALSAGGTTLYELCAVGVPAVSFSIADNQLLAVKTLSEKEIIPYAGDMRYDSGNVLNNMIAFLKDNEYRERRQKSSLRQRAFIDGNGASRIAAALVRLSGS